MNPIISSDLDFAAPEPESELDEKHDVANITPDDPMDAPEEITRADDHEAIKRKHFQPLPDLESADEVVHTWNITNWNQQEKRVHGPIFQCGGFPWRVLFFPFGNQPDFASFYLEHGYEEKPPEDWYACVQFLLVLSNPNEPSIYIHHAATHRFNADEGDWGFTRFAELRKLAQGKFNDEGRHLIEDGAATMTAYVRVVKDPTGVLWHSFINYDSKKETGMVGLKNQGATCYLNSLLQSLYFTNSFREAIYQIPTESETSARENSAYALQRLFYLLQMSEHAVSTNELTQSFGWESRQIFEQQDVQELTRILMERMEERMKGTEAERALPNLFVGQMKTYIECINVDYESSRLEDFWDIQLNVRGNNTLDDSFKDYIQVETMDGENKYFAEGFGLQDARKGVIFEKFPAVLHLQLKRFEYNFQADAMTKIYDRYEFPEFWDASPYLSASADRSEPYIYHLHGVLVHSGDLNAGHYYAFLKPNKNGEFYKFDDDKVTRATKKEALEENFGGDFGNLSNGITGQRNPYTRTWSKQRFMSAYMLVYIRESRLDSVLQAVREEQVPPHLGRKITEERSELERKRKEREEAHLYMQVFVGTTANFNAHQGFDIFPLASHHTASPAAQPKLYRLLRTTTMAELLKLVASDMGFDENLIRPWCLTGRQNNTTRPDMPIDTPNASIEEACQKVQNKLPFRLWIEEAKRDSNGEPDFIPAHTITNLNDGAKPILLFLKHFDVKNQALSGQGSLYIGKQKKISDLGPTILERMNWPSSVNLRLYEEIKSTMIEPLKTSSTFAGAELQDGDIICFQQVLSEAEILAVAQAGNPTDAPKFYDYLANKVTINFSDRLAPDDANTHFTLDLSRKMAYDQIAAKVGEHLKADPTHLRFSTVSANNGRPRGFVKRSPNQTLAQIMNPQFTSFGGVVSNQRPDWLLYEVLELSLSELETKTLVKVTLLSEGIQKEEIFDVLIPKNGIVSDLVPGLQRKANLSDDAVQNLRFYQVRTHRFLKELTSESSVDKIVSNWDAIYAELIPQEELDALKSEDTTDQAVYAFHFDKEPVKVHGVPFKFIVKAGEPFSETKDRISKRTGIKGKLLEKIKFAVCSRRGVEYLQDDDVLADRLITADDQLGLDHVDKQRNIFNRSDVMMIR